MTVHGGKLIFTPNESHRHQLFASETRNTQKEIETHVVGYALYSFIKVDAAASLYANWQLITLYTLTGYWQTLNVSIRLFPPYFHFLWKISLHYVLVRRPYKEAKVFLLRINSNYTV